MQNESFIGIIMGGPSSEHEISLQSGKKITDMLLSRHKNIRPIVVTQNKQWQIGDAIIPLDWALSDLKVAVLATHGQWGEDGHLQAILEHFRIPYTGSTISASAAAFNKPVSRDIFSYAGLEVPQGIVLEKNYLPAKERINDVTRWFAKGPWIVKPARAGSSVGVSLVKEREDLEHAIDEAWKYDSSILIEEFIEGTEVTCGILEDASTRQLRALPLTKIIPPPEHHLFDFSVKYSGETQEITPAPLDKRATELIQEAALRAHRAIGARHYSRVDMIFKNGIPYVLELNTLPGLTEQSLFPKQAQAAGISFDDLLEHLIALALSDI